MGDSSNGIVADEAINDKISLYFSKTILRNVNYENESTSTKIITVS